MANAALPPIEPPQHCALRPSDMPFWSAIIAARVRDGWTECDLAVASQLARTQADIERELKRGDEKTVRIDSLTRRQTALMQLLRLGGIATGKATREDRNALEVERTARRVRGSLVETESEPEVLLAS